MKFEELNLLDVGSKYMFSGMLFTSLDDQFIALFPDHEERVTSLDGVKLPMTIQEWEKFIKQLDMVETEMFLQDPSGKIVKSIVRKSQRTIDGFMQWRVFKRDNYTCRYCGKSGTPLTVDHIDLWEHGGITTEDNLITACKKCNKERGNMPYAQWLESERYKRNSANLPPEVKKQNEDVLQTLPALMAQRKKHINSR